MQAVIIATGRRDKEDIRSADIPELRSLVGRPWLEHVVEHLDMHGISQLSFIISRAPERIRETLGNGDKWGCTINYYTVKDPDKPYDRLKTLPLHDPTAPFLLGDGAQLPDFDQWPDLPRYEWSVPSVFNASGQSQHNQQSDADNWTGYAIISQQWAHCLPTGSTETTVRQRLVKDVGRNNAQQHTVPVLLRARPYKRMLEANNCVLSGGFPDLIMKNNQVEPGVWIDRNVILHPTARITPPVFIARDSRIEEQVELGPHVTVGPECVIDRKATITRSVIKSGSYIGEDLEVQSSIVDRNLLINTQLDTAVSISENFMLGSIHSVADYPLPLRLRSHLSGLILLLAFSPFLLLTWLYFFVQRSKPTVHFDRFLALPASKNPRDWTLNTLIGFGPRTGKDSLAPPLSTTSLGDFLTVFLPGLITVAFGHLHIVGVPPRPPEKVESLPEEWTRLYLKGKAGLITENLLYHDASPDPDANYAAEMYYCATSSVLHNLKLFALYFKQLFFTR